MPDAQGNPTLSDKLGQTVSPGLESFLSAVPTLFGAYESARGIPIGAPLQALGQMGLQHGANRLAEQQAEGDVASRMTSLARRGLLDPSADAGSIDAISKMTPKAAEDELSDLQRQRENEQNKTPVLKQNKASGDVFMRNRDGSWTKVPELSGLAAGKETDEQRWIREHTSPGHVATSEEYHQFVDNEKIRVHQANKSFDTQEAIRSASPIAQGRFAGAWIEKQKLPPEGVPGFAGKAYVDKTGRIVHPKSVKEILDHEGQWISMKPDDATKTVPALKAVQSELGTLATEAGDVLPHTTGYGAIVDWFQSKYTKGRLAIQAKSNPEVAQFLANRGSLAMQLQKVFTGSTRPMNLAEFNQILGRPTGKDAERWVNVSDVASILPAADDTKEIAQQKTQQLKALIQQRFEDLDLTPEAHSEAVSDAWAASTGGAPDSVSSPDSEGAGDSSYYDGATGTPAADATPPASGSYEDF